MNKSYTVEESNMLYEEGELPGCHNAACADKPLTEEREMKRVAAASSGSEKGERNGICNRSDCDNTHAIHYNEPMQKYYCTPCARRINQSAVETGLDPICSWPDSDTLTNEGLLPNKPGAQPETAEPS